MKRNSILFVIALIAVIAFAGSAQANPVGGRVNSTTLLGDIVTLYIDGYPDMTDNTTLQQPGGPGTLLAYQFNDISTLLSNAGLTGQDYNATIVMRCEYGSNTYRNTTPSTAHLSWNDNGSTGFASLMEIEPCPAAPYIDLNVSEISVNPSCKPGSLRANTTNEICAKIVNDGTAAAGEFNVSFVITGIPGGYSKEVTVTGGIPAGENRTVCITDYPPTSPGAVTINVTADCNLAVGESDEGNNSMEMSATVYNNGYMGKRLTGGEDINTVLKTAQGHIDLNYAVCNATTYVDATGEHDFGVGQTYLSGSTHKNWTEYRAMWDNHTQFPNIPSGETIKKATLYVHYSTSYYPDPDFNVSFNGMNYTMDDAVKYTDVKGWPSTSEYGNAPSGMLAYDVTSGFDNTTNTMVVYNLEEPDSATPPATKHQVTMQGAVLMVIYEHEDEPERIIYVNEGFDLLTSTSYSCCTPAEATAYANFTGVPNPTIFANATLITIATDAFTPSGHSMFFNSEEFEGGLDTGTYPTDEGWSPPGQTSYNGIAANETDVRGSLQQGDNEARFQSDGDGFCMANAILKLEKREEVAVSIDPCPATIGSDPSDRTTVDISLNGIADYGSGTIHLYYDPLVVEVDAIGNGDSEGFRANPVYPPSTSPYIGGGHVEISAWNTSGVNDDVTFVNVTFRPTGVSSDCTSLNLTVETLYDRNYAPLDRVVNNCSLCIVESNKPIVSPPIATPAVILNDTPEMRARVQQTAAPFCTNVTNLTVFVTDDTEVAAVYVNLTPILGAGHNMVKMTGPDGSAAGTWYNETNASYSSLAPYHLNVMAVDRYGTWNNGSSFTLTVDRRGDVRGPSGTLAADNEVNAYDYYYIARYTVGLEPAPEDCTAQVQPADSWNGVDMADALYIAMYVAHGTYPAP